VVMGFATNTSTTATAHKLSSTALPGYGMSAGSLLALQYALTVSLSAVLLLLLLLLSQLLRLYSLAGRQLSILSLRGPAVALAAAGEGQAALNEPLRPSNRALV